MNENKFDDDDDDKCDCKCGFLGMNKFFLKKEKSDVFGTPLLDTPMAVRRMRAQKAGALVDLNGDFLDMECLDDEGRAKVPSYIMESVRNCDEFFFQPAKVHEGLKGELELKQTYEICEVLGVGSTSTCHRAIHKQTKNEYACKIIDKKSMETKYKGMGAQLESEIVALQQLQHPNIITLYDVYITSEKIYIVMELMKGGELFDYVVQKGTLTEDEASFIVRKVISALVYMHEKNIIHRDLKPENLMLKRKPLLPHDLEVKIIDFGLSKQLESGPVAQSFLGTRGYLAPEMLQRKEYSHAVDSWALGIIVYVLLCGCLPFDDSSEQIDSGTIQSKFRLRFPKWAKNLSSSAKDLLNHLLDIDPYKRYSARQAFEHPWVSGKDIPKNNYLSSPGRISFGPNPSTPKKRAKANQYSHGHHRNNVVARYHHNHHHPRDMMGGTTRHHRKLVRKTSI